MAKRTIVRFESNQDVWPIAEVWARERNHGEMARGDIWRRYQQGSGWLVAPKCVEIKQEGNKIEIQGWIKNIVLNRIIFLFLLPAEMDLGKGIFGSIPRGTARRDVNILLEKFGQPPIVT